MVVLHEPIYSAGEEPTLSCDHSWRLPAADRTGGSPHTLQPLPLPVNSLQPNVSSNPLIPCAKFPGRLCITIPRKSAQSNHAHSPPNPHRPPSVPLLRTAKNTPYPLKCSFFHRKPAGESLIHLRLIRSDSTPQQPSRTFAFPIQPERLQSRHEAFSFPLRPPLSWGRNETGIIASSGAPAVEP